MMVIVFLTIVFSMLIFVCTGMSVIAHIINHWAS
jgi:hypothetical protein